jgi:hypothetical protein
LRKTEQRIRMPEAGYMLQKLICIKCYRKRQFFMDKEESKGWGGWGGL